MVIKFNSRIGIPICIDTESRVVSAPAFASPYVGPILRVTGNGQHEWYIKASIYGQDCVVLLPKDIAEEMLELDSLEK